MWGTFCFLERAFLHWRRNEPAECLLLLVGFEDTPDRTWILLHADLPKFCLICAPASCLKGANKQKTPPKEVCEVKSNQSCGLGGQSAGIKKERSSSGSSEGRRKSSPVLISGISFFEKKWRGKWGTWKRKRGKICSGGLWEEQQTLEVHGEAEKNRNVFNQRDIEIRQHTQTPKVCLWASWAFQHSAPLCWSFP